LTGVGELSHDAHCFRICTAIQTVAPESVNNSRAALTQLKFFDRSTWNQMPCESLRMLYLLIVRGAHDLETSAVLETGRACKSAAVCTLATLYQAIVGSKPTARWER
jgi:hypothetical protein